MSSWNSLKILSAPSVKLYFDIRGETLKILSLECDLEGKIAVALTQTSINIFNERELLNVVEIRGGSQLKISSNLENIFSVLKA